MNDEIKEIQKLIDEFNQLKIKERSGLTFLEIAKCPHLENVWSNILAFFINPNKEHKLYDLLLKSIFDTIKEEISIVNLKNIRVKTEKLTELGNRIDIVVVADNFVLGIENKVDAPLYNNLKDYSQTIDNIAGEIKSYKIVLSKNKNSPNNGFKNIIYSDFIKAIRRNIGNYTDYADTKYLTFFLDFLKNIENNINSQSMNNNLEVIHFLQNNVEKINKLLKYHKKFNLELVGKLDDIDKILNRATIKKVFEGIDKKTDFMGCSSNKISGRITWQGLSLSKYQLSIGGMIFFYQIGIRDYNIVTNYWFDNDKYKTLIKKIEDQDIKYLKFNYDDSNEVIAKKVEEEIVLIINILSKES